ncbi:MULTISPECIES: DUF975 family protein [Clostridium]|nr:MULTISPECIES: DUF975 family protein [Clostridium]AXB84629.1 DUF975 family protein [Clostridium butyricum]KIU07517.1 integral membrane protein [Clostridium butyricum]MBA8967351.1 putative membrane protein [Clostridium butyricum]MBA8971583.1 putative membrane protein [Clostridium butyricum]MBC2429087.1 DUF975 family protein [Clostridium butyricum]
MRRRAELKEDAKQQLRGKRGTGALITLILFIIALIPSIVGYFVESEVIVAIMDIVVQIYVTLLGIGCLLYYFAVRRNEDVSVGMLFSGCKYYLKGFCIVFLSGVMMFFGFILFIIPGIILSLMYSQALYIYIDEPEKGIIECLRTSRLAMKGYKGDLFVLNLSFIGWGILCALTLGLLALYVTPYCGTTLVNFYTDLMEDYREKERTL